MKHSRTYGLLTLIAVIGLLAFTTPNSKDQLRTVKPAKQKIQVAILLDVSGSMDGLIEQAKAQLWNMVSVLGKANNGGVAPEFEIALYEYGRTTNAQAKGYVKQISPFTNDLDEVSKNLFALSTNGGDEYCGKVIFTSIDELTWDSSPNSYKVIFIAGNEDFLQGDLHYTKACAEANKKGVIVNTIYCGEKMEGIRLHWNLNAECGQGSYTNINQDAVIDDIVTPYDSTLIVLNDKFNSTYLSYGVAGAASATRQKEVDQMNTKMSTSVMAKRVAAKGQQSVYRNDSWDLVDGMSADPTLLSKIDRKTLPDSLQTKSDDEIRKIVSQQAKTRGMVSNEIQELNRKREEYIRNERARAATDANKATLESEVEKIIKQQAKRFSLVIE
jgi:hypothetical protein